MCLECDISVEDPEIQARVCKFCGTGFAAFERMQEHALQCQAARNKGQVFSRKNHFGDHLQDSHDISLNDGLEGAWNYAVESDWPRECGFCGDIFLDWEERVTHIARHFEDGLKLSSWKAPFCEGGDSPSGELCRDTRENNYVDKDSHQNGSADLPLNFDRHDGDDDTVMVTVMMEMTAALQREGST